MWFCPCICKKNRNVCPLPPDGAKRNCEFVVARTAKMSQHNMLLIYTGADMNEPCRRYQKYFFGRIKWLFNRLLLLWWFFYLKYKFMSCILNDEMTYGFEIAYLEPMPEAWYCNVRNCMLTPNMLLQGARAGNLHIYVDRFFSFSEFQVQDFRISVAATLI